MAIEWSLYETDITELYLNGGKTAAETIAAVNAKHGCAIRMRQFKAKFRGLKNINEKEWKLIGDELNRRRGMGEICNVYLKGHLQSSTRVKRETQRYSKSAVTDNRAIIDLGNDTIGKHRIEIRNINLDVDGFDSSQSRESLPTPGDAVGAQDENSPNLVQSPNVRSITPEPCIEIMRSDQGRQRSQSRSNSFTIFLNTTDTDENHISTMDFTLRNWDHGPGGSDLNEIFDGDALEWVGTSIYPSSAAALGTNFPLEDFNSVPFITFPPKYQLFWDSPKIRSIFRSTRHTSSLPITHFTPTTIPKGVKGWLSSHLASISEDLKYLTCVADQVEEIIPMRADDGVIQSSLDDANPELLQCAFSVVAYLTSNNLLDYIQIHYFARWVVDGGHAKSLSLFLHQQLPNTKGFAEAILLAICNVPQVLDLIADRKGNFHYKLRGNRNKNIFVAYPNEAFDMLLAVDKRALKGKLGTSLWRVVASSGHMKAANMLVDNSAHIDDATNISPLNIAAILGKIDMLQCIIKAGADINMLQTPIRQTSGVQNTALANALFYDHLELVAALLSQGAKVEIDCKIHDHILGGRRILKWAEMYSSVEIFNLLKRNLGKDECSEAWLMVQEAQKGNRALGKFLRERNVFGDEALERGLYYAVKWGNKAAVRTFLGRGVDPNTRGLCHLREGSDEAALYHPLNAKDSDDDDMIYLLVKAGARVKKTTRTFYVGELITMANAGHSLSMIDTSKFDLNCQGYGSNPPYFFITNYTMLLDAGYPINSFDVEGLSMLQHVAASGDVVQVQYLISRGAEVNFPAGEKKRGRTALQAAAEAGNISVVECLLEAGANVNAPPAKQEGLTVLEATSKGILHFTRSMSGDLEHLVSFMERKKQESRNIFKDLLYLGAPTGGHLLHSLLHLPDGPELLKLALQAGANVDERSNVRNAWLSSRYPSPLLDQCTPLQLAASIHHLEAIKLLLSHGAQVNAEAGAEDGRTALQGAMTRPEKHITDHSPFTEADANNQLQCIKLLLLHGADINAPPGLKFGRTALQATCSQTPINHSLVHLLLEMRANLNAEPASYGGITALQGAVIVGDTPLIKTLLTHHADVNAPASPENGRTAVEAAAEHGRSDILRILLNQHPLPDTTGFSKAIGLAEENNHWGVVHLLEEHRRNLGLDLGRLDIT